MPEEQEKLPRFTRAEVAEHKNIQSAWTIIEDKVFDITTFLDQHPGGEEVLLEQAGQDATESFDDVGHSSDAREIKKEYLIGELAEEDKKIKPAKTNPAVKVDKSIFLSPTWTNWLIPTAIAITVALIYRWLFGPRS